jgi:alpha-galactosidase
MSDPIGRLQIINGASYLYPTDTMAAYIGPSPNHQNGRVTSLQTRFLAGFFCAARGLSLSESDLAAHRDELFKYTEMARRSAEDMIGGRFDRLINNGNEICWQLTSADNNTVYVLYFHILSAPNLPFRRAYMTGLDAGADYLLSEDGSSYKGDGLMNSGLALPYVTTGHVSETIRYMDKGDFSSHLFIFKKQG